MKPVICSIRLAMMLVFAGGLRSAEPVRDFLAFLHGDERVDVQALCWPHDDLWMARGERNEAALREVAAVEIGKDPVQWFRIQNGLCIVEVRDGRVDARFVVDQFRFLHRQLLLRFVYAVLRHDREEIAQLATRPDQVKLGRWAAAAPGDLDVYQEVLALMPVVRLPKPTDAATRSATYRLPLGPGGCELRMVKRGPRWLIDTDQPLELPLDQLWQ
jgi:hypothetical protein